MSDYEERFGGIQRLYGVQQAQRIRQANVCVIGIGGVGSWAVEALVRSGVEKLTLIDKDRISSSNINRQIHSLDDTLQASKIATMAARIQLINPACKCELIEDYINETNLFDYVDRRFDFVIDAIDSIQHKAAIIYYCKRNKIPVVTTGGAGGLTDPTAITIADLTRTWNDALAAKVRSRLRYQYGYTKNSKRTFGVKCVFSTEQQRYPNADGSVDFCKPGIQGETLDCYTGFGSSTAVTASFGFAAAAYVMKQVCKDVKENANT